jgi:hypothetical protein
LVIFDRVKEEILDINADLDYVSATAAGAVNAVPLKKWWKSIQYGYNVIDGLIRGHSMPDIAADTVLGGTPNLLWNFFYGFFDELLGQQDYYDRNTGVYPFRNEKE